MTNDIPPPLRLPLLAVGFLSLAFGVAAGLARMGWPVPDAALTAWHGPLMVCGFFGTVISLERAVALTRPWAYLAPLFAALGAIALLAGASAQGMYLLTAGSALLLVATLRIFVIQPAAFTLTLLLGAACWTAGNGLWLVGASIPVSWWIGFLVFTIAGERLELSRLLPPSRMANAIFAAIVGSIVAALVISPFVPAVSAKTFAGGLLALSPWLLRQDIARRTVRQSGLTRFIAVCLLSGYVWLGAGALMLLSGGGVDGAWDAGLHAILLGFVFSMVFGHAPIIFPAVTRAAVPYHWSFYAPLALLHLSLALRVFGDLAQLADWRRAGGAGNAVALLLFVVNTVAAVVRGRLAARRLR